jgi:hypothetical protein
MKIILGDFNAKVVGGNTFKPTIRNKSLHHDNNYTGVRKGNFVTSNNSVFKSTMFLRRNIHKYTWTYPDVKTHNQIDHIDRKWHSRILDVRSVRIADCDTGH